MNELFSQGGKGSVGINTNKQAIARHFGVKQSEVVYFSPNIIISGYKVIYDPSSQRGYRLTSDIPAGTVAINLTEDAQLVLSGSVVDLGWNAVVHGEFVALMGDFTSGATVRVKNELLTHDGVQYYWNGAFPKVVPPGSTPQTTGGLSPSKWVSTSIINRLLSDEVTEGDFLVRVKATIPNSFSNTVHGKMREFVTIGDGNTGAEPDGVKDCTPALHTILAASPATVRFPWIPGTANIYYFSAFDSDWLPNVTLDVDYGVKLSLPDGFILGKPSATRIKLARATQFIFRDLKIEYTGMPSNNEAYAEKSTFLEQESFDKSVISPVMVNTGTTPVKISWPSSDIWVSDSYGTSAADFGQFGPASGDDFVHVGIVPILPGEEISADMFVQGAPNICAVIRHTNGYAGVFATVDTFNSSIMQFNKLIGQPPQQSAITYPMLADHASYAPVNSEWRIRVTGFTSAEVLLNGMVVATFANLNGYILDAGFGGFLNTGVGVVSVRVNNPTKTKKANISRNQFMAVKIYGDSISCMRLDCWPIYLKKELEFAEGVRAWKVISKAVPGDTSGGQLALMQSEGVSDSNVVVIAVGTNDAQGMLSLEQYKTNLTTMVNLVRGTGRPVVLVKFGLWYTQAQSGAGIGQPAANYQYAARYRSVVARVAAETGSKLVDLTSVEGPIVGYYVNPNLAIDMTGTSDSTRTDAIHPTTMDTKLMARKIARAIMGAITPGDGLYSKGMNFIQPTNSWTIDASNIPARVNVSADGYLSMHGQIFSDGVTFANGTVIARIPQNICPTVLQEVSVAAQTANVKLIIKPNGEVSIYGAVAGTGYVSLSGIGWQL